MRKAALAGTGTLPRTSTITFESIVGIDMAITAVLGSTMSATIGTLIRGNPNPTNPFTKAAKTIARKTRTTCISIHPPSGGVGLAGRRRGSAPAGPGGGRQAL